MNTHATNLLTQLIDGLMNAKPTAELHAHQMLAAELKGAMQAQAEIDDYHPITCDCAECVPSNDKPTPDADGWTENTGVMPECEISAIKYKSGRIEETTEKDCHWTLEDRLYSITHYRPA